MQVRKAADVGALAQRRKFCRPHHVPHRGERMHVRGDDAERAALEHAGDMVRRVGGNANERRDAGFERGHADRRAGLERDGGMLQVHVERIEARGGGDARDLRRAHQPHRHRGHHLVALELLLDVVAQDVGDPHGPSSPFCSLLRLLSAIPFRDPLALSTRWRYAAEARQGPPGGEQARKLSMNYTTDFKSIRGQVSAEEWQARVDLAACYRLVDKYGMTDLIYN